MTQMISHPPAGFLDDIQHFVMDDASWELYERLLREIGNRPIRITYDNGRMEMMSPLPEHEAPKKIIGGLIEMLCFQLRIPLICLGSTTFRRKIKAKGLEPDECYYIQNEPRIRGKKQINLMNVAAARFGVGDRRDNAIDSATTHLCRAGRARNLAF